MNKRCALMLLTGCVMFGAYAQDEKKDVNLNPIVVTGTGVHQRLKTTPVTVEVITASDISKSGVADFQQLMTMKVPSLSFSGGGAMGTYLMMNGLSNKYVLILINGKKLIGDVTNNIDLSRIDLNRVKRIEILNGAASSLYGSDAIAGVINIITDEPKETIQATTNTRYEEYGQFTQSANVDINNGQLGSYTSFRHDQSDGWRLSDLAYKSAETLETAPTLNMPTYGYHSNSLSQKFTFDANEKLSFYANGGYFWKLTDRPLSREDIDGGYSYDMHNESYNFGLGGRYKINNKSSISLDLVNDNYNSNYKYIKETGDYKIGDYSKTKSQSFYDADLKGIFRFAENNTTVFGIDYRSEKLDRPSANVDKSVYTASVYGQHEIKLLDCITAIGGVRYDYHEAAKGRLTPKVSLMYSIDNFNFRGTYSAGFRAPGLDELYYNLWKSTTLTRGSDDLKPEKSNYFSLNAEYKTERFNFAVTGYLNFVDDMISSVSTKFKDMTTEEADAIKAQAQKDFSMTDKELAKLANFKVYQNMDKGIIRGVNATATYLIGWGFSLNANYAYASAKTKTKDGEWLPVNRSIRHTGTLGGNYTNSWSKYKLNVSLDARLQSKRLFPGDAYGDAPGYGVWNINTRHTFTGFKNFDLEPGIGINNIFDKVDDRPYGVNYSSMSPGRTVFASLTLRFKK